MYVRLARGDLHTDMPPDAGLLSQLLGFLTSVEIHVDVFSAFIILSASGISGTKRVQPALERPAAGFVQAKAP